MPKPLTLTDLVRVIRSSRLVAEPRLGAALPTQAAPEAAAQLLLDRLVSEGDLTPFQASRLGAGHAHGVVAGNYRLLSEIGSGGMGQVFLARHAHTGREVAVKVLHDGLVNDPMARARFLREANAAAQLLHPNVVRVLDVDLAARPPYLVMEYIDGPSLQAAVAAHGTFSPGWAAECGRQVALGLERAAEMGLVHRDIKPANVLFDRHGLAKILDLGIVRTETDNLTAMLPERLILGTIDYLAPEQAVDSHAVDIRADLYALGGTLYFLLAGHPPFPRGDTRTKLLAKQASLPVPVAVLRPDVTAGLSELIQALLAPDPAERPAAPRQVAAALKRYAAPDPRYLARVFAAGHSTTDEAGAGCPTPVQWPVGQTLQSPPTQATVVTAALPTELTPSRPHAPLPAAAPFAPPADNVAAWVAAVLGGLALAGLTAAGLAWALARG